MPFTDRAYHGLSPPLGAIVARKLIVFSNGFRVPRQQNRAASENGPDPAGRTAVHWLPRSDPDGGKIEPDRKVSGRVAPAPPRPAAQRGAWPASY